ncbi:contractile injection system tape measure protein [Ascidiimonas aurantiaca]|uniref:contractile injection system tape measure protein n=1 Tax=Ascidiimonas aurantiaca TaxID=1685432 RepID=UPI0030EBF68B
MKISGHHTIREQAYEITLQNEEKAQKIQSAISLLQESQIAQLIDRILTEFDEETHIYNFQLVELDLGVLSIDNYENELADRIEEALINFLRYNLSGKTPHQGQKTSISTGKLEALRYFLQKGYFNWNTGSKSPTSLVKELVYEAKDDLTAMLKVIGKKEVVRKRMVLQLQVEALTQIVQAVKPEESRYILPYKESLYKEQEKNQIIKVSSLNFKNVLWEIILAYLFVESRSYYNKKSFLQYLLQKTAEKYRLTYTFLLQLLSQGIVSTPTNEPEYEFRKILKELTEDHFTGSHLEDISTSISGDSTKQLITHIDEYVKTGIFTSETSVRSKEELLWYFKKLLKSKDRQYKNYVEKWFSEPLSKARLLAIADKELLSLFLGLVQKEYLTIAIGFFETLRTLKTTENSIAEKSVRDLWQKKEFLILEAYHLVSRDKTNIIIAILEAIHAEFDTQKESLYHLWQNIKTHKEVPVYVSEALSVFLKQKKKEPEELAGTSVLYPVRGIAVLRDKILHFVQNQPRHLWDAWFREKLPHWSRETSLDAFSLLRVLRRQFEISFSSPEALTFVDTQISLVLHNPYEYQEKETATDANNKISGQVGADKENKSIQSTNESSKESSIDPHILITLEDKIASVIAYHPNFSVWSEKVVTLLRLQSDKINVPVDLLLDRLLKHLSKSVTGLLQRKLLELKTSSFYREEIHSSTPADKTTRVNNWMLHRLQKHFSRLLKQTSGYAAWKREAIKEMKMYGHRYGISIDQFLTALIKWFDSSKLSEEENLLYQRLLKLEASEELRGILQRAHLQKSVEYKKNVVFYTVREGVFPWWALPFSYHDFNAFFKVLALNTTHEKALLKTIREHAKQQRWHAFLNEENYQWILNKYDTSSQKTFSNLSSTLLAVFEKQLLPLGLLSHQQLAIFKSDLLEWTLTEKNTSGGRFEPLFEKWISQTDWLKNPGLSELLATSLQKINAHSGDTTVQKAVSNLLKKLHLYAYPEKKTISITSQLHVFFKRIRYRQFTDQDQKNSLISQLEWVGNNYPNQLREWMTTHAFREGLVNYLEPTRVVRVIRMQINPVQEAYLDEAITVFGKLEVFISTQESKALKKAFFQLVLLKIGSGGMNTWGHKNWGELLYSVILQVLGKYKAVKVFGNMYEKQMLRYNSEEMKDAQVISYLFQKTLFTDTSNRVRRSKIPEDQDYRKLGEEEPRELKNPIFVNTAGLVIISPFLGMLFTKCGFMENSTFINTEAIYKAIHLLHYTATGNTGAEEYHLPMSKVLCGFPVSEPVKRVILLEEQHKEIAESLLEAVIKQWSVLKNTSVAGLRETFLQRDGKLEPGEEMFYLRVEQKPFDMLLDQLPWSIGTIKLSWMTKALKTEWR